MNKSPTASFTSERHVLIEVEAMLGVHDRFLKGICPLRFSRFSRFYIGLLAIRPGDQQELHNAWGGHKFLALGIHVCRSDEIFSHPEQIIDMILHMLDASFVRDKVMFALLYSDAM